MKSPVILIRHATAQECARSLRARYPDLRIEIAVESELSRQLPEADILLAFQFPSDLVSSTTRLRWYQSTGAGVDTVLPVASQLPGMVITNAKGIHADLMADYVMAGIAMMKWDFRKILANQADRTWVRRWVTPLSAMTIGVVGVGAIGSEICRRAKTAGMTVLGYRRSASVSEHVDEMFSGSRLHDMLPRCDIVVLVVPTTPETTRMFGAAEFACMKRDAILINIARGEVVDEPALVAALRRGDLGGALLDVFEREPLPVESPLWDMPNVIVTPHMAGAADDYVERMLSIFCDNLDRFMAGQPLRNVVDPARGY